MPLLVNHQYHLRSSLEAHGVRCLPPSTAREERLRTLRVGIINLMPQAENYELNLLLPLGKTQFSIEPVWIRLQQHDYQSSDRRHLAEHYLTFDAAIGRNYLDGLILTGAPVEEIDFREVHYWGELQQILNFAQDNITSTIGLCWGAMALAYVAGIEKINFPKKLFGVFLARNLDRTHRLMSDTDDLFWCPQSRHAGYADQTLERASEEGKINLLAHSEEAGYIVFETKDRRFLMHLGHPEYNSRRLVEESLRDGALRRADVWPPKNFNPARPVNCWRGHRAAFFSRWANSVYKTTSDIY